MTKAESQLKRYKALMNNALDGLHVLDMQGNVIEANQSFCDMLGYTPAEALKLNIADWNSQWSKDELLQRIRNFAGKSARFETVHRRKDGTLIDVEISTAGVEIDGQTYLFASSRDITLRKKAEKSLQESEKRLRSIIETEPECIKVVDARGQLVEMNAAGLAMLEADSLAEAQQKNLLSYIHPDDRAAFTNLHRKVVGGESGKLEFRVTGLKGAARYLETHATPLRDQNGEITSLLGVTRDITERKVAEEKLKKIQVSLAAAQELAHIGSWEWDVRSNMALWSDETYRIFGIEQDELSEHRKNFLDLIHPEDRQSVDQALSDALNGVKQYDVDYRIRRTDGKSRVIHALAEVMRDGEGKPVAMRGTVQDITERKEVEQKIQFLTQIYAAQSQTNQALIESKDEASLFDRICRIVVEFGGLELAWIGVNEEESGRIKPVSAYGRHTDYLDNIAISSREDEPTGRGPTGTAFREKRSIYIQNQKTDPMLANWRTQTVKYGWGSSGTVPILRGGKSYAVLAFYHTEEGVFTGEIIGLLNEMGKNIGRGLDRFDLEQEKLKAQESMQLAATIYRTSVEAIMVTDQNNRIVEINPAFTAITGYTLEEVRGQDPRMLQSGKHNKQFYQEMWQSILSTGHWRGEIWDRHKNGRLHAKLINISLIRHPDGSIYRFVAQFSDITDKKQKEELIWKQANFDSLTGLPNRHMFRNQLEQELLKSQRSGSPVALLFIDLDRFKEINDALGHAKGDLLLMEAAHRIKMNVRIPDMVARLGGDEFTVILPEFGERLHLERIVQDLITELVKPFDLGDGHMGFISASIGITVYPDDADDIGGLLKHADQAMYAAKAEGRNRFSYFTQSMQQEAREKLALTNDLRQALARNELHVYYQPILELHSGQISKAEALLRWKHPVRGMVSPAIFIPLAEEAGLIHEIGDWVFQQAVARVADWRKRFGRIIQVSVNKSPIQFEQPEKYIWQTQMQELGIPGNGITVEITEGLLLKESIRAKERLLEFRNRGIEVSIDDFGTGFSSLSYLKQFDIDYLKIDRSFVQDLEKNEDDKALTEAIIVMAHKLGIRTIAEGVETEQQRDLLKSFGCDYVQGFLYSPAVPAAEFEKMVARRTIG
ncbi:cyclic di-GMP phosphodiesterase Gmr [mine drainage metagenome]|uniref:Cyclic di-GMP phosphodiesterase Gmr n=1 Tax=mine drainage metagenome TaxID=410659 RepID=A0A1J5SRD8_9ZZZZ